MQAILIFRDSDNDLDIAMKAHTFTKEQAIIVTNHFKELEIFTVESTTKE